MNSLQSLYGGLYDVLNVHPYKILNNETQALIRPPGVTTIIGQTLHKEGLALWPMRMALEVVRADYGMDVDQLIELASQAHTVKSDSGKNVGTDVHFLIEQFLIDQKYSLVEAYSEEVMAAYTAFRRWCKEFKPKILATERIVYSQMYNYAGKFDVLLDLDGKITLCDIKTTNASNTAPLGIYAEYFLQLGAYALAYAEEGQLLDELMVINASKSGELNVLKASDLGLSVSDCVGAWVQVVRIYKFLKPLSKKIKEKI